MSPMADELTTVIVTLNDDPPDVHESSPEERSIENATATTTTQADGSQGDDADADADTLDEIAVCRRVREATVFALERVLEFRYSTADHPQGEPSIVFLFGCNGSASNYSFQIRVEPKTFSINGRSPVFIPSEKRLRVAEFLVRVNFTVVLGHFDLDFDDGELRYRIVHDVGSGLDANRIVRFFGITLTMMDKYFPAMMQLTYGNMTPEEAIRSCERDSDDGGAPSSAETVEQ